MGLNEQFEKTKKNIVNETSSDVNKLNSTLSDQSNKLSELYLQIERLQKLESAYNSDKKMFYRTIEEMTDEIENYKKELIEKNKAKSDYEQLYMDGNEKIKALTDLNDS